MGSGAAATATAPGTAEVVTVALGTAGMDLGVAGSHVIL